MGGNVREYTSESLKRISNTDLFVYFSFVNRMIKSSVYIYHNFILQWIDLSDL
jgi:hypothetical protein